MRERYSKHLATVTGALIVLAAVAFGLVQSPGLWALSAGTAVAEARPVPHAIEGRQRCDRCHGRGGVRPYPIRHLGWSNESCTHCHAPGQEPPARPREGAPAQARPVPHPLEGYEGCGRCHGPEGVFPFPDDHRGFPDDGCTECHPGPGG
jgi:hypothetical protein